MNSSRKNRVRLSVEALERRDAPAALTASPPSWVGPEPVPLSGGVVVQWSPDGAGARSVESATADSHARPFHAEDSGVAVFNPNGTISASASGHATHLGKFTLHDTSTIVGSEITPDGDLILHVAGL